MQDRTEIQSAHVKFNISKHSKSKTIGCPANIIWIEAFIHTHLIIHPSTHHITPEHSKPSTYSFVQCSHAAHRDLMLQSQFTPHVPLFTKK